MFKNVSILVSVLLSTIFGGLWVFDCWQAKDTAALQVAWENESVDKVGPFGTTNRLEILPLVNWHAANEGYKTEPGVSYLVKIDGATILFDVGFNRDEEAPSPLEHNMDMLDISTSQIDAVFLSHNHADHVGGFWPVENGTFSLGNTQDDLSGKRIFAPVPIQYPNTTPETILEPKALMTGVASTGPIARRLSLGAIDEQALIINVEGKGLVAIVGCGHQTTRKLVQRIEEAFDEKLYGIVGDLHYPVPNGRLHIYGIDVQRRLASGGGIFEPLTRADIDAEMAFLESRDLGLIAVGGHDTSDDVLSTLAQRFEGQVRSVEVGTPIVVVNDN